MYSLTKLKEVLANNGFDFKKMYGQNFIIDPNIIRNIVSKALVDNETLVIEIGPGAGALTSTMCDYAKNVLCYEIDDRLKPILNEMVTSDNVCIKFEDFLKASVKEDIEKYDYKKLYVVANLPYYITTPIIVKLIEDKILPDKIVVMVQKEVGNRLKALPGSKDYSSLSVFLNYYYDVKKELDISKNVFIPKPNVDSIVVSMNLKKDRLELKNEELFFKLIRDSFKMKRKNLRNNLKEYDLDVVESILQKYGFDLSVRAEALSLDIFVDIANNL